MGKIIREPWRINTNWGTIIVLSACSFGLEMDGRCHVLYCKFRCEKAVRPERVIEIGNLLCPRECEYEGLKPNETSSNQSPKLVPAREV